MAKLPRKTQKIFCSKPTSEKQTSVFGTMKTADKQYSTDVGTLQSNAAYEQGWKSATIASYKPFMEDFNTLNYINTSQLAYLFQQGIPEWDEATAYYKNSFCSYNGDLWQSLIDDNLGNAPFEGDEWTLFTSKNKGGGLELCDIGMALYVDETKGLRRYLNGQIVDINANTQAFLNRLLEITTLHPSLLCTEDEWQSAKTLSAFGQVGKFVFNYSGDEIVSVRIPAIVNVQGLFDLQNLGMTVGQALPIHTHTRGTMNITGTINIPLWTNRGTSGAFYEKSSGGVFDYGSNSGGYTAGFDANRAWTGNTSAPNYAQMVNDGAVQQEAIQYPYFIQVATGQETENNIVNDIELNTPSFFGDSKYVPTAVNNLSWLKSEGQSNPKGTYPSFYDWILENVNKGVKGFKLSTATDITDYDFIINTTDETFRLPLKNGTEGMFIKEAPVVSNGLPIVLGDKNTYSFGLYTSFDHGSGSFNYVVPAGAAVVDTYNFTLPHAIPSSGKLTRTTDDLHLLGFDQSGLKAVLSNATAPEGWNLYYYVGETVQNANLIDAGRIGEILPTKTDMQQAAKASMPSDRYIDLTLGATNTPYTAPADGWFYFETTNGGGNYFGILTPDGIQQEYKSSLPFRATCLLPISKGKVAQVYYDGNPYVVRCRFYYAEGAQ